MMTKPAVISGTYADLKTIRSRSTVQIVVEVPIERGAEIVEAFGFPQPGSEVHVVVARLANGHAEPAEVPAQERRQFVTLPRPQQAALVCQREAFQRFMHEEYQARAVSEADAANEVRIVCGISSRADLIQDGSEAAKAWDELYSTFQTWMQVAA